MLIVFVLVVKTKPKGEKLNLKKKGIIALASTLTLAGVAAVTPIMLTGCSNGKDGIDGRDGTIWKSGTSYTQFTDAKVGDYFIDTDDYILYQKTKDSWVIVMENYGRSVSSDNTTIQNIELQVASGYIQWRNKNGDDTEWKNLIEVSTLKGANGYTPYIQNGYWYINGVNQNVLANGNAGKEIEIRKGETAIEWRHEGDEQWIELVELSLLKGQDGTDGQDGINGTDGKSVKIAVNNGNIEWRYTDDSNEWQTIIATESLKGANGTTPHIDTTTGNWFIGSTDTGYKAAGVDGKEITLQVTSDYIQWKYIGDAAWNNLIPLSSLKGADGATWTVDTEYPSNPKLNDLFLNNATWEVYKYNGTNWISQGNIKGAQGQKGVDGVTPTITINENGYWVIDGVITNVKAKGEDGKDGKDGQDGRDGISVYVGYDGYIWTGTERSSYKVSEATFDDYLVTDTIGLINHSKYFNSSEIDMNNKQVVLMDYYFENINKTNYSGLDISTIDIYSTNTGTLTIGTANVETAIANKATGTPVELNNKKTFSLQEGVNSIKLNLKIGENETLVLGNFGDTATLLSYSGIPAKDNMGEHLIITNGEINTDSIKEYTDSVANKLVIKTTINNIEHSTISSFINKDLKDTTEYTYSTTLSTESYFSQDYMSLIEGKTLTKVDFPLYTVPSIDEDQYLTFYVVGGLVPDNAPTYVKEYQVCITKEQLTNATLVTNENYESLGFSDAGFAIRGLYFVGEWITATKFYDVENDKWIDELTLLGDQNIAWQKIGNNDVSLMFKRNAEQENLHQMVYLTDFGCHYRTDVLTKVDLHVNWYVKNYNYSTHLKQLYDANQEIILKNLLSGKSVSILGDSISTYSGVSEVESPWYGQGGSNTILKQAETWWQQLIDSYNMELLVNDSVGGAGVYTAYDQTSPTSTSGFLRADNMKTDTENPDFIFVLMGTNDKNRLGSFYETIADASLITDNGNGSYTYATPDSFADACYIMLHKIKKQNPNAKIYYLLPYTTRAQSKYNAVISEFCDYLNIYTIDLGETELINYSGNLLLVDGETSCHPNATGMDLITNKIIEELKKQLIN